MEDRMDHRTRVLSLAALAAFSLLAGCGSDEGAASGDQASADSAAPAVAAPTDTSTAGMQHAAARDPNQEFARMMVDHHQGMIVMAQQAMERGSTEALKTEAHGMHQKQETEQKELLALLQREYQDTHQPTVTPSNRAMADSLSAKQGADYDMAFRMHTIAHHREGIGMIDQFLPRLTRPELRTMAERMKADQSADIQKLEREMGHS
jgi:uncharacterized protein (DUF305 family)